MLSLPRLGAAPSRPIGLSWPANGRNAVWLPWVLLGALGLLSGIIVAALPPFAALVAVLGAIASAYMFINPLAGLIGFCAVATLLPFGVIPVKLGARLTFLDAVLGILTFVWLLRLVRASGQVRPHGAQPVLLRRFTWLVLLWIAVSSLSFVTGAGFGVPHGDVIRYYLKIILATILFVITIDIVRERAAVRKIAASLVLGGFAASATGIVLYFMPHGLAGRLLSALHVVGYPSGANVLRFRVDFNHAERAIATSVDPNVLGGLLVLTGAMAVSQLFAREHVVPRWLAAASSATIGLCLLLTYSRGAWIAMAIALVFMATWQYRRLLVLLALAFFVFLQLPASHTFTTEFQSGVHAKDKAAAMRLGEVKDSIRLITRYPFFGVGFGGAPDRDIYVGVSNIYLQMAEETGIVGLSLFLVTGVAFLLVLLRSLPGIRDPQLLGIALGTFGGSIGAFTAGMFDRYFFSYPHDIALMWFYLALSLAIVAIDQRNRGDAPSTAALPATA